MPDRDMTTQESAVLRLLLYHGPLAFGQMAAYLADRPAVLFGPADETALRASLYDMWTGGLIAGGKDESERLVGWDLTDKGREAAAISIGGRSLMPVEVGEGERCEGCGMRSPNHARECPTAIDAYLDGLGFPAARLDPEPASDDRDERPHIAQVQDQLRADEGMCAAVYTVNGEEFMCLKPRGHAAGHGEAAARLDPDTEGDER